MQNKERITEHLALGSYALDPQKMNEELDKKAPNRIGYYLTQTETEKNNNEFCATILYENPISKKCFEFTASSFDTLELAEKFVKDFLIINGHLNLLNGSPKISKSVDSTREYYWVSFEFCFE